MKNQSSPLPEFQARLATYQRLQADRERKFRYIEIWGAVIARCKRESHAAAFNKLPFEIRMRTGRVAL